MKRLKYASVDITYDCNFRCLHCFNSSGEHKTKNTYLNEEKIIEVVSDLSNLEPDSICLCGGETMLRKTSIYKILDAKKEGKIKNSVNINCVSNGFLIDEETAKTLADKKINFVQISVDGATAQTHDWLRNTPGSFDKAINAIQLLVKNNIQVGVAFTPTKLNIDELANAIDLVFSLGVFQFRMQPTMNLGRARKNLNEFFLDNNDYLKIRYILDKQYKKYLPLKGALIEWGDPLDHLHLGNIMNVNMSIGAYGDIIPSPYMPLSVGNVKEHRLSEYINNGILNIWSNPFINTVATKLNDFMHMDTKELGLPEIFLEENIILDILDENYENKTKSLLKQYFNIEL